MPHFDDLARLNTLFSDVVSANRFKKWKAGSCGHRNEPQSICLWTDFLEEIPWTSEYSYPFRGHRGRGLER